MNRRAIINNVINNIINNIHFDCAIPLNITFCNNV